MCPKLQVPALTHLSLEFSGSIEKPDYVTYFPLASAHLEKLTLLCNMTCNTFAVLEFLATLPALQDLVVREDSCITAEFIRGLALVADVPPILPVLRRLDIEPCYLDLDSDSEDIALLVCEVLESRYERNRLESVRVPAWLYHDESERWADIRKAFDVGKFSF